MRRKKHPKRRPVHPKRRIRSKKSKARKSPKKRALPIAEPTAAELAQAEGKGARVRLNPAERQLLAMTLLDALPKALQKAHRENNWWNADYRLREKFKVQRSLITRLISPRRGHPSTW